MERILAILQNLYKVIDLILIAVVIIAAWSGYKKGVIMGVGGIIVIIVAVFGGNLLSNTFSYEVIPALHPFASGYVEKKLESAVYEELDIDERVGSIYSLDDLIAQNPDLTEKFCEETLKSIGIFSSAAENISEKAVEYADENGISIKEALVSVVCERLAYAAGFLIFFLLILIILTVIGNIPNLSFKFPYLDIVNDILGAVLGIITGLMICVVIVWALKFLGIIIKEDDLMSTKIASWFMEKDYLARYIGL